MPNLASYVWRAYSSNSLRPVICMSCGKKTRFPQLYHFRYRLKPPCDTHHRMTERVCGLCHGDLLNRGQ